MEVQNILKDYYPYFESPSLDEAYLDFTDVCTAQDTWDVVEKMRKEIYEKTKLTCSAGIAPTKYLAKIASDYQKPNGQFMIENNTNDIMNFISKLNVKKVKGIGAVTAKILNALNIETCQDILEYF